MTNNEDRIEILEDAKEKLIEVIDLVRQATRRTDEELRVDSYILPHLSTWVDDARGSSGTAIESLLEIFRGDNDDPEDDDDDENSPEIDVRHEPIVVNNDGDTVEIPASAREAVESDDGSFCGKHYELHAMNDGPTKKFYLIHWLRTNMAKSVGQTNLKEFSCAELADAAEYAGDLNAPLRFRKS